jgi:CBS domain-containing protein
MTTVQNADIAHRTVADIMQHDVAVVPADMPLSDVARLLWDEQVSGAPVVTADERPIGIVSASDLVRVRGYGPRYRPPAGATKAGAVDRDLALLAVPAKPGRKHEGRLEPTARDVMTPATFAVRTTTTIPELARFLMRAGVHRALVLDQGHLLGIVTAFDIVEEVARGAEPVEPDEIPFLDAGVPEY